MSNKNNQSGYIIMISVMLIGAVATTIAVSLLSMGIGSSKSSLSLGRSKQARALAHTCVDEALINIYQDNLYTGTSSTTVAGKTCNFSVTNTGGNNRTIDAWANVSGIVQKTRVQVDSVDPINIIYWQEVADL